MALAVAVLSSQNVSRVAKYIILLSAINNTSLPILYYFIGEALTLYLYSFYHYHEED
jgi:hypothetical protein